MANLVMIPQALYVNPNLLIESRLGSEDIKINVLRQESVLCHLDTLSYTGFYLDGDVPEHMNWEIMVQLKNCNAATILVEPSLNAGQSHMFITDTAYAGNLHAMLSAYAASKNKKVYDIVSNINTEIKEGYTRPQA